MDDVHVICSGEQARNSQHLITDNLQCEIRETKLIRFNLDTV